MRITGKHARCTLAVLALAVLASPAVKAENFAVAGNFTSDDDLLYRTFTVQTLSLATFQTTSAVGGGFDPVLSLFAGNGAFLADADDDDFGLGGLPAGSKDSFLQIELDPGTYSLALSQYDNFYRVNPDGTGQFSRHGQGNFTGPGGPFVDADGVKRTGAFVVAAAYTGIAIPEPSTYGLVASGLLPLALFVVHRRRRCA